MRIVTRRWVLAAMLAALIGAAPSAGTQTPGRADVALEAAAKMETVDGDLKGAIGQYQKIVAEFSATDRASAAKALVRLGQCYEKLGSADARRAYERAVQEFSDQKEMAAAAQARLLALSSTHSGPSYRQVWAAAKANIVGTVSPDGRYLSCTDWDTGDLALHDLATGGDRRLTNKGTWYQSEEFAEQSAISRDGTQVAYAWFNGKDRYELRIASLPATGLVQPRRLFDSEDVVWLAPFDWSPDGQWIAVALQRKDRSTRAGLISVQTGSVRELKAITGSGKMFFSPDGKFLGLDDRASGLRGHNREVVVLAVDGSGETKAVADPGQNVMMGWALDGRHLLYASDSTGSMGLWAVRVAGGKPQGLPVLLRPNIGAVSLGVAASGALYVGATISDRDIVVASLDFSTGKVLSPPARPIRTFLGSNAAPDWSPDGKSLAYTTDQRRAGGDRVLSVRSMETGDVRELRPSLSMLDRPRWAPDGRSFVSHGTDSQGRQGIYQIDAQTGEVTAIAYGELGHPLMYPQWSPDGTRIYYIDVIGHAIVERDLASGAVRELARLNGLVPMTVSISPDGRYFAARATLDAKSMAVLLFPTAGGAPRELLRVALSTAIRNGPAWLPDSRGVAILKMPDGDGIRGTPELWLVPIEGGTPRRMDLQVAAETNLMRVHPDGRRLAYVAGETKYEVLVLENFLPAGKAATK